MDFLTQDPLIFGAVAAVFGLLAGMLLAWLISRLYGSSAVAERQTKQAEQALETYKADVTAHFEKSAELFGNLTDSYRAVYEHMAGSAQGLCDTEEVRQRIAASSPQALPRQTEQSAAAATSATSEPDSTGDTTAHGKPPVDTDEPLKPAT